MLKSERINFLAKKVAPNPLEATYWIDLTEDPQGTVWKWYDPEDNIWKVLLLGNQEGTLDAYTKAESDRIFATNQSVEDLVDIINSKQDQLVSEVNIKTINGTSILGSGDISIDRGLNQNQVQDLIDESTKDFITVDETHEYVQEEIAKLKLVVLDKTKLPESIYNLIFNEEVDYSAIEEDLLTTENQLLYIDPDNGMYRLSYNQVTNQIDYVYTTIVQGKVIEQSNSLDDEGLHQNYTISKDIVLYTDNQHDGITIQCEKNGINREVTLFSRGDGESYLSDDGQYKVIGAINLYTSMDRLPDKLGVLLDNTAITLDNFNNAKTYLTELGEPVYLLLTDKYNPTEKEYSTIEGNQLHTFYYDNEEDCIYIVEYINPLHQIYSNDNPLGNVVEITKISNTAQAISRRINRGIYSDSQGFNIQVEDNTTDSSTDPNGTTVRRHLNVITEGNGKDVLFNDGEYRNLQDSIDFSNYLAKDNTESYTPTGPYNPATKKYVDDAILDLIDSAPSDLDTLRELANAINNDPNFSTTIFNLINELNSKVDDLENQSGSTGDSIQQIIEDITNIEGDIVDINNSITNIENQLGGDGGGTSITETITNIQNNITNIEGDVTDIKQDITEINNELNSKFELPDGGTTGQVLKKQEDGSVAWADDEVGESGGTNVQWQSDLTAGEVIGTLTINGNANVLYAPESNTDPVTPSTPGLMTPEDKEKLDGIAEGADDVKFAQVLTGGTKIGTITINGTATDIYAPAGSSGEEGSTVSYTPIVTSGVQLGTIVIDGVSKVIYAPEDAGSDVTWSATQTSGTKIGTLNVDGTDYVLYAPTPTTYNNATTTQSGLMSSTDKSKLDGIRAGADSVEWSGALSTGTNIGTLKINDSSYNLYAPTAGESVAYDQATATILGLVKIGYPESGKNYPVELNSSGQMFVNVPWTDTNTTYSLATTTTDGLMSSEDKTKLDSISSDYNLPVATTTTLGGVKSTDSPYQATSTKKVRHYYNDGDISFHLVGSLYCSNLTGTSSGDYFDPVYGTPAVDKVYNTPFPIDDTITDLFPDNLTYTTCSVAIEIPGLADEELYENTYLKVLCNLKSAAYNQTSNNRAKDYLVFADSNSYYVADFELLSNGIGVTTFSLKGYITPTCINYLNTHTNVKAYYVCLCSYKQVIEDSQYTYSDAYSNVDFYRRPSIGNSKITSNTKVTGYTGIQGFYDTLQQIDSTADDCPNLEYVYYEINNSEADTPEVNSYYVTVEDSGKMRVDTPSAFEYITLKQGDEGFTVEIEDGSGITEAYVKVYIPSKYTQKYNHIKIEDLVVKYSLECYDKYHSGMIVASYKHPIQYGSTWGEEELIPVYFAPQGTLSQPRTIFVNCYKTVTQATDGGYSAMMQFSTPQESSYSLRVITVAQVYMNLICYN